MKQKITTGKLFSFILVLIGISYLIYPWFGNERPINLFYFFLGIYSSLKFIEYLFQKEKSDKENLYATIASVLIPLLRLIKLPKDGMLLPLSILTWVAFMSIVKLIKLDYLHDRGLPMFRFKLVGFIIFIVLGIITSYSLYFEPKVQIIIMGFFITILGVIDLSQNTIKASLKKPRLFNLNRFKKVNK